MKYTYTPPVLTVDGVVFQLIEGVLNVLLINRAREPFRSTWALPGGYIPEGETTMDALQRVLRAKAGVDIKDFSFIEQLYTVDTIARDPRGHAVSVIYMALSRSIMPKPTKTTEKPTFFPIDNLPKLAYDHSEIIINAHTRLKSKISYTNAIFALLPAKFTFRQLQKAYEAVLGRPLDKRNFRKKFFTFGLLIATDEKHLDGAHRPARLYKFKQPKLQDLLRSFD